MSIAAEQRETAALLRDLAGRDPVETHISAVFIGADTVWKLKKSVRLSFLDFTALQTRHRFLLRELEVNRAAAPGLYRDVVPVIRRPDGTLTLGDAPAPGSPSDAGPEVIAGQANVAGSDGVARSDGVAGTEDVTRSERVAPSDGVTVSAGTRRSEGAPRSDGVTVSESAARSEGVIGSEDVAAPKVAAQPEVVDWVLRMAPVPAEDFLDVIAERDGLTPTLLDQLADTVAAYHQALPPAIGVDWPAAIRAVTEGNARAAHDAGLPARQIDAWLEGALGAIEHLAPWLAARSAGGSVRRAHGDLHLGNLCLWHGAPVPFDALEFDESMATIDLAYDLAFLLMDLDHRVTRSAANRVLNRYVARTGDAALTRGLPIFMSLRAMIRAQVEATRGNQASAAAYLDRALAYLAPPGPPSASASPRPAPLVIGVGGMTGTGKSTLARGLAPTLGPAPGALVLRSDEIRKRQHDVAPEQRLPDSAYTLTASDAVFAELTASARIVAAGGHSVIADAMFLNAGQRAGIARAACDAGARFLGLWLTAPLDVLEARVAGRKGDASDATLAILHAAAGNDRGGGDWISIDAIDADRALAQARRLVQGQQAAQAQQ